MSGTYVCHNGHIIDSPLTILHRPPKESQRLRCHKTSQRCLKDRVVEFYSWALHHPADQVREKLLARNFSELTGIDW